MTNTVHSRFKKARFKKEFRFKKIVAITDFLVHNLFDLRKIFFSAKWKKKGLFRNFRTILGFFQKD